MRSLVENIIEKRAIVVVNMHFYQLKLWGKVLRKLPTKYLRIIMLHYFVELDTERLKPMNLNLEESRQQENQEGKNVGKINRREKQSIQAG